MASSMRFLHENKLKIPFGSKQLDATLSIPAVAGDVQTAVLLTHGAGGDMNFRHLVSLAEALASNGIFCLRFTCKGLNLIYRVKAYSAVMAYVRNQKKFNFKNIFIGGRSMGARAAAALVRQLNEGGEDAVQGLICLSFPLHPPGQTHVHVKRSEDLLGLTQTPVLFVSGAADEMCQRNLLEDLLKKMKAETTVEWMEGGSHGLAVKGRAEEEVMGVVNSFITAWVLERT